VVYDGDAPVPGIPPWENRAQHGALASLSAVPMLKHGGGWRETQLFDRFWNAFAGDPSKNRRKQPESINGVLAQPGACFLIWPSSSPIPKDVEDNKVSMRQAKPGR